MGDRHPKLSDYPLVTVDKLRYSDTDRQGHINNAVFATFLETGRVEAIYGTVAGQAGEERTRGLADPGAAFVIARLELDFLAEIHWPGEVQIGTRVLRIGTSSLTLDQVIFQGETCAARASSVIVQMDETTRKSRPFSGAAVERLKSLLSSHENA
ncbi:acyl-CoA thioesterase [Microvirga tunisiensis]|uniref:Acyl-CoA thioesterase n=1 Tax=Pannonibacter tanglangensis TaxID=2750084 RepID=A0A7X5F1H4_9HYPH|nr:thioesterase family protein [Pannonibacter sp. XCT-53]NBN77779.1 acyl-CoA thioesterase [Pannonibacter sp. XCT-53]